VALQKNVVLFLYRINGDIQLKIFAFISLLLCLLGAGGAVRAEPQAVKLSPDLQLIQLNPDLWVHRSWFTFEDGSRFYSNGLIARYQGEVWMIDTAWSKADTAVLLDWVEKELKLPVHAVFATHSHADKTGGSPVLFQRQVPFYSSALTRLLSVKENIPLPLSYGRFATGDAKNFGPFELYYPGPGHTDDNMVVYLSSAQVLFGGCAIKAPRFPGLGCVGEADLQQWPDALQRLKQRYAQASIVVPGHGEIADRRLLDYSLALFKVKF